jgi:hypothetical protein
MPSIAVWLLENPFLYETICSLSIGLLIIIGLLALLRQTALKENRRAIALLTHPATFIIALAACITIHRLPFLYITGYLNIDESQALVSAIKFQTDWVPWRSVDNGTIGPFMSWLLNIFHFLGLPLNYSTARIAGIACLTAQWSITYLALRLITTEALSRVLTCGGILFSVYSSQPDFVHYSSEHLPNAVLAGAWLCGVLWIVRKKHGYALAGAILLGLLPWIKIQYAPFTVLFIFAALARTVMANPKNCIKPAAGIIFSAAIPTGVMTVILLATASFSDFFNSYILANLQYSDCPTQLRVPLLAFWPAMSFATKSFSYPLFTLILISVTVLIIHPQLISARVKIFFVWFLTGMIAAALAVSTSGRAFWHYYLIVILAQTIATGLFCGALIQELLNRLPERLRFLTESLLFICLSILLLWPQSLANTKGKVSRYKWDSSIRSSARSKQIVAGLKKKYSRMPIALWGYRPDIFVALDAIPATRDISTQNAVESGRLCTYYRNRFLSDLKASRPPVLIDAVTSETFPSTNGTCLVGFEMFKELKTYVAENYVFSEELVIPGRAETVRVYRLNSSESSPQD